LVIEWVTEMTERQQMIRVRIGELSVIQRQINDEYKLVSDDGSLPSANSQRLEELHQQSESICDELMELTQILKKLTQTESRDGF
jgi:hypothetical protein